MGDVGSLALGGGLGILAVLIKQEVLLIFIGGVFVIEAFGHPASRKLQAAWRKAHFQNGAYSPSFRGARLAGIESHRAFLDCRPDNGAVRSDDVEIEVGDRCN